MKILLKVFPLVAVLALTLLFSSCASTKDGGSDTKGPIEITKVNPYHLKLGQRIDSTDQMIMFEVRHHIHGAIEGDELLERFGHHFSIFWKNKNKTPATVRLEYTQGKTGPTLHSQEEVVSNPKRNNTTRFQVVGEDYLTNGAVTSWRVVVLVDGVEVEEFKSFLWKK